MNLTPEGTYKAVVDGITIGETSKGTPQIVFAVNVHVSTSDVRRRTITMYMSDKALPYTEKTLNELGFNGDFDNPKIKPEAYHEGIEVYCKHEAYVSQSGENKMGERWNFSTPRAIVKPASEAAKATLAQRWRAQYGVQPVAIKPATPPLPAPPPFSATKTPPPPPPVTGVVWDKNKAWDVFANEVGNIPELNTMWTTAVAEVARGRSESALTSADWEQVANAAKSPFI